MKHTTRARAMFVGLFAAVVAMGTPTQAEAQGAVINGKVTSEFGANVEGANVYISDLSVSILTNAEGNYTISLPAARVNGQLVNLRVRAVGYQPQVRPVRVTAGTQTFNFVLKQDVNRLDEIVVTGVVEGVERSKVPFAVARLTSEDIPVPALDPLRALQGKVAGVRIAQTSGQPGTSPEILMRGPTSINASGRSQGPLIIVDGAIMNVGSMEELGGLDIESVEVVKGAAGASLYGTRAANGVITIKTKRGNTQEGVRFNVRSEYGISDVNSLDYGQPVNHHLQIDETGSRFCIAGASNVSPCSRTVDWMQEIMRINNVNADTIRTAQSMQWNAPAFAGGELLNVYQSQIWPNQYYNSFAQVVNSNPVTLNAVDANGKVAGVRYYVSGSYTSEEGAIKGLEGQQQRRGRVNLDYDVRNDVLVSVSSMYDNGTTDLRSGGSSNGGIFGQLLRGAPSGTDYARRDTLGRYLVRGGGAGFRGTGNGGGTFLYDSENLVDTRESDRFIGNITTSYFPADWVTVEGVFAYDNRIRIDRDWVVKGYRTFTASTANNNGNMGVSNREQEAYNGSLTATFRKQLTTDLSGKLSFRGLFDSDKIWQDNSAGQVFVVKDVFTLSNTTTNKTATSFTQTIKNNGVFAGASADYKGKYIIDGTYRYDGSSLFGEGNRWAPFGRISAVWRVSEEDFWNFDQISSFRLRASRGTAGNTPRFDAQYETFTCGTGGCSLGQAGNTLLKPETTTETEIGTDFELFNRLGVEFTNARSDTKNQILFVTTPASLGFTNQWKNAGTLSNNTYEVALNLPVLNTRDMSWSVRGTWDRTRTYITELFVPEYFTNGGTTQGTGSLFLITARRDKQDGVPVNRYGNIWGRQFYKSCRDMPATVQAQCGPSKAYQVNDQGWVVWVGEGNTWQDGIKKNLWQAKLPAAQSPWNYPLYWGHPIIDRPLAGERGEGTGENHIIGNSLPDFRMTFSNNFQWKRFTLYGLIDGTFGHDINNQGEGWGLLDFNSAYFDQGSKTVEGAKPIGYGWRVGGAEGAGTGGFYDVLGPNNYNVEDGSFAKLREISLTYRVGAVRGVGDWTVGLVGRNLMTFTNYSGYDPEVGVVGGQANSGLINQVDAFDFPTLRTYTVSLSTRF
ncbi:MAG TPA: SusC/RagA family TonB-linked outer membrane protein [Gemmatimonadaceae bacterium]|nr:SusC/RagA family TonB-linked outer membrane protein [Gemmatimonadaceae bacterium]